MMNNILLKLATIENLMIEFDNENTKFNVLRKPSKYGHNAKTIWDQKHLHQHPMKYRIISQKNQWKNICCQKTTPKEVVSIKLTK